MKKTLILIAILFLSNTQAQQLAVLKYNGGGDWYSNPTAVPNLITYCNDHIGTQLNKEVAFVEPSSVSIFQYPFIHMTGHGNVVFNEADIQNLKNYLLSGGFLHIDDNYGMDQFISREIKKIFPNEELIEIPFSHPIYHQKFDFNNGLPKIHEHDGEAPVGLGIIKEGRLVLFYSSECDLGDGWEDREIHNDSEATRLKALKMGANIVSFVFLGE